jgi:cytidyltransferase-like protein
MKKYDVVLVSGGFDPVHKGHVRMIQAAAELGEKVIVGVNSDAWLRRKKGTEFMPFDERLEIMSAFKGVYFAVGFEDGDNSANDLILKTRERFPDAKLAFANGGDRTDNNILELHACFFKKVDTVWNVGGEKVQSSSELIERSSSKV